MKLLLDGMWTPLLAEQLQAQGYDVEAVAARQDLRKARDPFVLAVATIEGRVVVTENIPDFRRLGTDAIRRGDGHAGLVFTLPGRYPRAGGDGLGRLRDALERLLVADVDLSNRELWL